MGNLGGQTTHCSRACSHWNIPRQLGENPLSLEEKHVSVWAERVSPKARQMLSALESVGKGLTIFIVRSTLFPSPIILESNLASVIQAVRRCMRFLQRPALAAQSGEHLHLLSTLLNGQGTFLWLRDLQQLPHLAPALIGFAEEALMRVMDRIADRGTRYTADTRALPTFTSVCCFSWRTSLWYLPLIWRSGFSRRWSTHSSCTSSYCGDYSAGLFPQFVFLAFCDNQHCVVCHALQDFLPRRRLFFLYRICFVERFSAPQRN